MSIKKESFPLNSNHCPVCKRKNENTCIHAKALTKGTGLLRPFIGSENTRIFLEHEVSNGNSKLFDKYIAKTLEEFTRKYGVRDWNGNKEQYKELLLEEFYFKLDEFARAGFPSHVSNNNNPTRNAQQSSTPQGGNTTAGSTRSKPAPPHASNQTQKENIPPPVIIYNYANITIQTSQMPTCCGNPQKITKPPHKQKTSLARNRTQYSPSFSPPPPCSSDPLPQQEEPQEPQEPQDVPEQNSNSSNSEHESLIESIIRESNQCESDDPIIDIVVEEDEVVHSSPVGEEQLSQIDFNQTILLATLRKVDFDCISDFVQKLACQCNFSNRVSISEIHIFNEETKQFCVLNETSLGIVRDHWFGKVKCLKFKLEGIESNLPTTQVL